MLTHRESPPPAFSVVIPTYNRAHIVERAIQSVLRQTLADLELIVVDDGSIDETAEVIASIKDTRIQYFYQQNCGVSAARNLGITQAKGKYIAFLDSDDEVAPNWLREFETAFQDPAVQITCSGCFVTSNGQVELPKPLGSLFCHQTGLFLAGTFSVSAATLRNTGGYVTSLKYGENYELAVRLVHECLDKQGKILSIPKPLITYHQNRYSHHAKEHLEHVLYVLHSHQDKMDRKTRSKYYAIAGVNSARLNQHKESRQYFKKSIGYAPYSWKRYVQLMLAYFPILSRRRWISSKLEA